MIEMLKAGVLIAGSHNICYAHDENDQRHIESAYRVALSRIAEGLEDGTLAASLETPVIQPVFQVRS